MFFLSIFYITDNLFDVYILLVLLFWYFIFAETVCFDYWTINFTKKTCFSQNYIRGQTGVNVLFISTLDVVLKKQYLNLYS